jgi:hypothetical protein
VLSVRWALQLVFHLDGSKLQCVNMFRIFTPKFRYTFRVNMVIRPTMEYNHDDAEIRNNLQMAFLAFILYKMWTVTEVFRA